VGTESYCLVRGKTASVRADRNPVSANCTNTHGGSCNTKSCIGTEQRGQCTSPERDADMVSLFLSLHFKAGTWNFLSENGDGGVRIAV